MTDSAEVVEDFLAMWGKPGGFRKSIETYFVEDSIYENVGMSNCVGKAECLAFTEWYEQLSGNGWMVARTVASAVSGDTVLNERVDDMVMGTGDLMMRVPVMGSFKVWEGKILVWKDYFDTSSVGDYEGPGALAR